MFYKKKLEVILVLSLLAPQVSPSCCRRQDSGAQSSPSVVELRCDSKCLDGGTGEFWIGGREGAQWRTGGRTILHVLDHQEEEKNNLQSSMYVS